MKTPVSPLFVPPFLRSTWYIFLPHYPMLLQPQAVCLLPCQSATPASQSLSAVFNDSVHYVLYRQYKWRGGWMLATESGDDSEKMTGLWRREMLGKERRKERTGSKERKWWEEFKRCNCGKGSVRWRELGWKQDVKYRMGAFALFNMLWIALWKAEKEERIRETREDGRNIFFDR